MSCMLTHIRGSGVGFLALLLAAAPVLGTYPQVDAYDPPVLVTNHSTLPIYVQYYAEMSDFPNLIKSSQRVPAGAENFRAHGLFVYAQAGFESGMRDQDNKITVLVYTDAEPRELLATTVFHKELWDAQDIEKDEFDTLYIVFGKDHTLDTRLENPTGQ